MDNLVTKLGAKPKPKKNELSEEAKQAKELDELRNGPFSILSDAVEQLSYVVIYCHSRKNMIAQVRAFDRHFNMVLENVTEYWTVKGRKNRGCKKSKRVTKDRFISKMFLRGESVILVAKYDKQSPNAN